MLANNADNTEKVLMEEMSWIEIQAALDAGKNTVLIMAGAIEQHGPHLPTGTDTMLGYERGARLARALENALVAPVIRPGLSQHHMHFPGTITIKVQTFKQLLRDYCESLAHHGFKNMVLIPTHGGNFGAMEEVLPEIQIDLPDSRIILMRRGDSKAAHRAIQAKFNVDSIRSGIHAGLVETAIMLVHRKDLVQMAHAPEGWIGEFNEQAALTLNSKGTHALSANGVLGDARGATDVLGEQYVAEWTAIYARIIRERLQA